LRVDDPAVGVIHALKPEPRIMRYELNDFEWTAIKPMLPNKPRGVRHVNDRRVLSSIFTARAASSSGSSTRSSSVGVSLPDMTSSQPTI
jgi:hypothetical protein